MRESKTIGKKRGLKPNYRVSKSEANTLVVRGLGRLLPNASLTPRFDPFFSDGLNRRLVGENWSAFITFRGFQPDKVAHVGVIADSRGGSHLVCAQFHFLRNAFCFGEGFAPMSRQSYNFRSFLLRGMFGVNSLQDKTGTEITHLFYLLNDNSFASNPGWQAENVSKWQRYWLFVFRNPLRTLLSMQRANKPRWQLTSELVDEFLRYFTERLLKSRVMEDMLPDRVISICYEQFLHDPEETISNCCNFVGVDPTCLKDETPARTCFKTFVRCGSRPIEQDGYLVSPISGERILGAGGGFNPLAPIDCERGFSASLESAFPHEIRKVAQASLGQTLFDILMADEDHRFQSVGVEDLRNALNRR